MSDDQDWGWRVDLKSYIRWLLYDQIYDWLRTWLGRTSVADVIAAAVVIYAYARGHTGLLLFALGVLAALSFVLLSALVQRLIGPRTKVAALPAVEIKEIVNQTLQNQEVPLDGYRYISCTFKNVTFVYNNGPTGGFDQFCRVTGSFGFVSREERMQQVLGFLRSLSIIRPDAEGRYTPILNEELRPIGESVIIKHPDDLAHYFARIVGVSSDVARAAEDFKMIKEYVQDHWDELVANQKDRMRPWLERNFPDAVLTEEDIKPLQEQMIAAGATWRNTLQKLISLLHFSFEF